MNEIGDYPFLDILAIATLTLATVGPSGQPHAAPVYFVAGKNLLFYFFSAHDSQHIRDLDFNPEVAVTIYPESRGWRDIRGLQMQGSVRMVEPGPTWEAGWAAYCRKFPFVKGLSAVVTSNSLYVFTPNWIRMLDNQFGFGFKREWNLD